MLGEFDSERSYPTAVVCVFVWVRVSDEQAGRSTKGDRWIAGHTRRANLGQ